MTRVVRGTLGGDVGSWTEVGSEGADGRIEDERGDRNEREDHQTNCRLEVGGKYVTVESLTGRPDLTRRLVVWTPRWTDELLS